jgi:hypothetical protein
MPAMLPPAGLRASANPPTRGRTRLLAGFAQGLGAGLALACGCVLAQQAHILVQSSPLAGFRHYEAPALWGEVRQGDELTLVREPGNAHDTNAVRVDWRGLTLGYVPRAENAAVARQMDRGNPLLARVSRLQKTRAPNRRIEFEILLPLGPTPAVRATPPAGRDGDSEATDPARAQAPSPDRPR